MKKIGTYISAALVLSACGGSGGSSSPATPADTDGFTLTAIDGYLFGAEVCIDENEDRKCGVGEEVLGSTDENGQFAVPSSAADRPLAIRAIVNQTVDQDDGLPITEAFDLAAPAGSTFITPFTHLAAVQNKTLEQVATDLGVDVSVIAADYIAGKSGGDANDAKQAHKIAQFIVDELQNGTDIDDDLVNRSIALKEAIDDVLEQDSIADIDTLIFVVADNGAVTNTEIPSLNYATTGVSEYFTIWFDVEGECGLGANEWVVEKVRYAPEQDEYSLSNCAESATATFNYTETGPLSLDGVLATWETFDPVEVNKRTQYVPAYEAFKGCFFEGSGPYADSCSSAETTYEFTDAQKANQLLASLRGSQDASNGIAEITVTWVATLTEYTQGAAFLIGDSVGMQCDLNDPAQVGEVGSESQTWSRNQGEVTVTSDASESGDFWSLDFNSAQESVGKDYVETEIDPTGEANDIFSNEFDISELYTWSDEQGAFVGSLNETITLTWNIDNSASICVYSYDVVATPQGSQSEINAFLGR